MITRDPLLVPNLDYLIAALEPELRSASRLEPALAADRTIRLIRPDQHETLPPWGEVLVAARDAAATSGPALSTFVWGDLRPRNVLVRTEESGQLALRLLDPDPRGRGDWTRDIARLGHGLRLEIPAAGGAIAAHPTLSRTSDATEIRYGFDWPSHLRAAEEFLLAEAQAFAEQQRIFFQVFGYPAVGEDVGEVGEDGGVETCSSAG